MAGAPVWVGTSWKMNKTIPEALAYLDALRPHLPVEGVRPFVLPPLTALAAVSDQAAACPGLVVGAQNAHWEQEGSGATGEVSMRMIADAGATLVEIGHSDRRARFGETDATVAKKVRAALDHGLTPLVCVGEDARARAAGAAESVVLDQLEAALDAVSDDERGRLLLAYEPVWAIGPEGTAASAAQVAPVIDAVAARLGRDGERGVLYGGSVDRANLTSLLDIANGVFVGRSAWSAGGFAELLTLAAAHVRKRSQ